MSVNSYRARSRAASANAVDTGKIWWVGLLAIATAVVVNLVVRAVVFALLDLSPEFPPLQAGAIGTLTAVGVGLGAVVFAAMSRWAKQPIRTFRTVALVALVISILPNFALMFNPSGMPFPGASALEFGVLIIFHVLAASVCIYILTTLTRR